jgi:hypothetical protein
MSCTAGSYCPAGASSPLPCERGTYSNATDLVSASQCSQCKAGHFCSIGSVKATPCAKGHYSDKDLSHACEPCRPGTFQKHSGATECIECEPGSFCQEGSSSPLPCPAGTYSNRTDLTSEDQCTVCAAGTFCSTRSIAATECSPGSYASTEGSGSCRFCEAGTYQEATSATACKRCAMGSLCPLGASLELPASCSPGQYANFSDASGLPECFECAAGFSCAGGAALPAPCTAGSFANATSSASCTPCPTGTFQRARNATQCLSCVSGSYCPLGASAPMPCPAGTFSTATNLGASDECSTCPPGRFCAPGSTEPKLCSPGTFAAGGNAECATCTPGTYQDQVGAGQCEICGAGSYSANILSCIPCGVGEYCVQGAAVGMPCSLEGSTTVGLGAASESDCVCKLGLYMTPNGTCVPCPWGTDCLEPAIDLERLPVLPGYWRAWEGSSQVRPCYVDGACLGGWNTSVSCVDGHRGPYCDVCSPGFQKSAIGTCIICEGNSTLTIAVGGAVGAVLLLALCCMCRTAIKMSRRLGVGADEVDNGHDAIDTAVLPPPTRMQRCFERASAFFAKAKLGVKLRILIALSQVLGSLSVVFEIPYPPIFSQLLRSMSFFAIDVDMLSFGCLVSFNFHASLLIRTLWPLTLLGVTMGIHLCPGQGAKALSSVLMSGCFTIFFLVYPTTSSKIFSTFQCFSIDDPAGSSYLRADFSIDCNTNTHMLMRMYAMVMVLVYPLGMPLVYFYLLFFRYHRQMDLLRALSKLRHKLIEQDAAMALHEKAMHLKRDGEGGGAGGGRRLLKWLCNYAANAPITMARALLSPFRLCCKPASTEAESLLPSMTVNERHDLECEEAALLDSLPDYVQRMIAGYSMHHFWFEIFECGRKLALVCFPVFFQPAGSVAQLIFGLMVCFITFGEYMMVMPYEDMFDNRLAQLCQMAIFFCLLSSIVLKYDEYAIASPMNMDIILTIIVPLPAAITILVTLLPSLNVWREAPVDNTLTGAPLAKSIAGRKHGLNEVDVKLVTKAEGHNGYDAGQAMTLLNRNHPFEAAIDESDSMVINPVMIFMVQQQKRHNAQQASRAAEEPAVSAEESGQPATDGKRSKRERRHFVHGGGVKLLGLHVGKNDKDDGKLQAELFKQVQSFLTREGVHDAQYREAVRTTIAGTHHLEAVHSARNALVSDDKEKALIIQAARLTRRNIAQATRQDPRIRMMGLRPERVEKEEEEEARDIAEASIRQPKRQPAAETVAGSRPERPSRSSKSLHKWLQQQQEDEAVARQSAVASANEDCLRKKEVLRESIAQRRASLVHTQQQQQQSRRSSVWRRRSSASGKARASVATPSATESSLEADLAAAELAMLEAELAEAEAEAERLTQTMQYDGASDLAIDELDADIFWTPDPEC